MKNIALSTILLCIWIIANLFFQGKLDDINESITLTLQKYLESSFTNMIMNLASKVIVIIPLIIIVIAHFSTNSLSDSFYTLFQVCFSTFINTGAKIMIKENRPFFERDKIKAISCECNYAMPSGHSNMITITVLCMLVTVKRMNKEKGRNQDNLKWISILSYSCLCLVVTSRVYFGVHTVSQIIMGFLFALFMFDITELFRENFTDFLKKKNSFLTPEAEPITTTFNTVAILCVVTLVLNIPLSNLKDKPMNEATKRNLQKCPHCSSGLMRDTIKGILPFYAIPSLYLVVSMLVVLRPQIRNTESKVNRGLRLIVYIGCFIVAGVFGIILRSLEKKSTSFFLQITLFFIMLFIPLICFLLPIYILRGLDCDIESDYVNFESSQETLKDQKLSSLTNNRLDGDFNYIDDEDEGNFKLNKLESNLLENRQ